MMFKQIVVPLDGSSLSEKALPYAIEVARRFGAEVLLIQAVNTALPAISKHTDENPPLTKLDLLLKESHEQDRRLKSAAEQYLKKKLEEVEANGIKGSYHLFVDTPFHLMMEYCRKSGVDLVVMTTHGLGGIKRAILGSTADKVIRESKIPVLVIRPSVES